MSNKTFAIELGAVLLNKLERLAEHFGHENKSKYALTLVEHAINEAEMWMRADLYAKHERIIIDLEEAERRNWEEYLARDDDWDGFLDDDIPF
jgi:predicted DNA-binding protein